MGQAKPPKVVPNRDNYARISYSHQVSMYFNNNPKYRTMSRAFAKNVDLLSKRTVLKITPGLKRTMCKKCNTILIPGLTMKLRMENKSKKGDAKCDMLIYECRQCNEKKRFPVGKNRDYVVFSEREGVSSKLGD